MATSGLSGREGDGAPHLASTSPTAWVPGGTLQRGYVTDARAHAPLSLERPSAVLVDRHWTVPWCQVERWVLPLLPGLLQPATANRGAWSSRRSFSLSLEARRPHLVSAGLCSLGGLRGALPAPSCLWWPQASLGLWLHHPSICPCLHTASAPCVRLHLFCLFKDTCHWIWGLLGKPR